MKVSQSNQIIKSEKIGNNQVTVYSNKPKNSFKTNIKNIFHTTIIESIISHKSKKNYFFDTFKSKQGSNIINPEPQKKIDTTSTSEIENSKPKINQDFSKLYTKDFEKEILNSKPNSVNNKDYLRMFKKINFDIIWQGLAIGLLLGALSFYFQALQPLILKAYAKNSLDKITQLEAKFQNQVAAFNLLKNTAVTSLKPYNSSEDCTNNSSYIIPDRDTFTKTKSELLPDEKLMDLPKFQYFYNSQIENRYAGFFNDYQANLADYARLLNKFDSLSVLLDYKNQWISACTKIQKSQGKTADIQVACKELLDTQEAFKENMDKSLISNIQKINQKSLLKCQETQSIVAKNYPNFANWQLDWLSDFGKIMKYDIDLTELNEDPKRINNNFKRDVEIVQSDINKIVANKITFPGLIYLMEFKS